MKTIIYFVLLVIGSIIITSCKTNEHFYVYSPVDAEVYLPSKPSVSYATVKSGQSAKIETPSDGYLGYIILKDNQTGLDIPVGMNVHSKSTLGTKAMIGTGYALTSLGIGSLLVGTIMACTAKDDEDLSSQAGIFLGAGAAASGIGAAIGMTAQSRLGQLSYDYQFTYDKKQKIDISTLSTKLLREDHPKGVTEISVTNRRKKATSGGNESTLVNSSKAKKNRSDLAKNVIGIYQGSGVLLNGNRADEEYNDIKVEIKRIDKNHVSVTIVENGEEFFEAPLKYEVSVNGKKGYTLILEKVPNAIIEISKAGVLTFIHKNVNIDNEIYTLSIKGKKNR